MKKIWIGIAVALVAVFGLVFLMQGRKEGVTADELSEYVPQDALLLVSLTNLNTITDNFGASPLGQFFSKDTIHAILADMGATSEETQAYDQWYDSVASTMKNPVFRTVFGDDLTVVLLPPDIQLFKENAEQALRRSLMVYATTSTGAAAELFGGMAKGVQISKEQADGLELTRIQVDNAKETYYGYNAKGIVLLAQDKAPILAGVKAKEAGAVLKTQPGFQEASDFWRDAPAAATFSRGYYNVASLTALLPQLDEGKEVQEVVSYLKGLDYGYDITDKTAKGLENKSRIKIRYDQLHDMLKTMVDEAATGATMPLSLVNDKTLFFQWGYSLKPEAMLKLIAAEDPEGYANLQTEAQAALGIPLEDAASAFGPRYGMVLDDIVETGIFPLPDLTVFANVRNRGHMNSIAAFLNQQVAAYGLSGEQQQVAGNTQLYSWPVMTEVGLVPALGLNDSLVFLGTMRSSMQPLLASQNESAATLPADLSAQLGPEMSEKVAKANGGAYLLRSAKLAAKSQSTLDLLNSLAAPTTGISFTRLGQEISKLMQATELVAGTSTISKEAIDWDTVWIQAATTPKAVTPSADNKAQ